MCINHGGVGLEAALGTILEETNTTDAPSNQIIKDDGTTSLFYFSPQSRVDRLFIDQQIPD